MPVSDLNDRVRRTLFWTGQVKELTPFTPIVQRALATLDDDRSSAKDLAAVIEQDEAMVSKILRLVNSAFYGVRGQVTTISRAVPLLGFDQLRMVILGVAMFEQRRIHDPFAEENRKSLWEHSVWSARWAAELARATRYPAVEEATLSAMLHDIGKVVMGVAKPYEFMLSKKLISNEGLSSCEAERRAVGINHVEVGRMVADYWRFPPIIRYGAVHHHTSWPAPVQGLGLEDAGRAQLLQAIVRTANCAARQSAADHPSTAEVLETIPTVDRDEVVQWAREVDSLMSQVPRSR